MVLCHVSASVICTWYCDCYYVPYSVTKCIWYLILELILVWRNHAYKVSCVYTWSCSDLFTTGDRETERKVFCFPVIYSRPLLHQLSRPLFTCNLDAPFCQPPACLIVHAPLKLWVSVVVYSFLYPCIHMFLIKRCTCILKGNIFSHEIYVWCTYLRILLSLFQGMARSAFMASTSAAGASWRTAVPAARSRSSRSSLFWLILCASCTLAEASHRHWPSVECQLTALTSLLRCVVLVYHLRYRNPRLHNSCIRRGAAFNEIQ